MAVIESVFDHMTTHHHTQPEFIAASLPWGASLAAAALALSSGSVWADVAPERASISYKYLNYKDSQADLDRISVNAPSFRLLVPIAGEWSIEGIVTTDTVSGASPSYHSEKNSAATMHDIRRGKELRITRYFPQGSITVGGAYSSESDYDSRAFSVLGNFSTEDKNTTFHFGLGLTRDRINPANFAVIDERKRVNDVMIGITQILSTHDIAQINLTHASGQGYFSDPYKFFDNRPREKTQTAVLTRWNHHFDQSNGTSRLAYRYYHDSYGINAHTVHGEYVQPLSQGWTIIPGIRLYSQSAAQFYLDPVNPGEPVIPNNFEPGTTIMSQDQRLSAFGARSFSIKIIKEIHRDWLIDVKYEHYRQQNNWSINAKGSPGISPFNAQIFQIGLTHYF